MKKLLLVLILLLSSFTNFVNAKNADCANPECIKAKIEKKQKNLENKAGELSEEQKQHLEASIKALSTLLEDMKANPTTYQ